MQATVSCPLGDTPAQRIHSRYERTLANVPWAEYRVRLQLHVRRGLCRNRHNTSGLWGIVQPSLMGESLLSREKCLWLA